MKYIEIMLMPWKWGGRIVVGGTRAEIQAYAKKWLGIELSCPTRVLGHAYIESGNPWLLWLKTLQDIPSLAHEAFHVTSGVLEDRGLKFSEASEEAYTYTMEDLLRQVLNSKRWIKVR